MSEDDTNIGSDNQAKGESPPMSYLDALVGTAAANPQSNEGDTPDEVEHYMALFDVAGSGIARSEELVNSLQYQPYDEARVKVLGDIVRTQQDTITQLYSLIVEMNNYFGSK